MSNTGPADQKPSQLSVDSIVVSNLTVTGSANFGASPAATNGVSEYYMDAALTTTGVETITLFTVPTTADTTSIYTLILIGQVVGAAGTQTTIDYRTLINTAGVVDFSPNWIEPKVIRSDSVLSPVGAEYNPLLADFNLVGSDIVVTLTGLVDVTAKWRATLKVFSMPF